MILPKNWVFSIRDGASQSDRELNTVPTEVL